MSERKVCTECGKEKPTTEFYGKYARCKQCTREDQNAANWYNAQFVNKGEGVLLSTSEIASALDNGISCIWVNIDRVGLDDIKTAGISDAVIADLKKYAEASSPYTIIVKGKIDGGSNYKVDGQSHYYNPDGRIYVTDNKTIVGSYGSHVMYNVALCTKQGSGSGNNVIIRNLEMQHDANANGNDNIVVYFGSGQNLWVDHVTFVGHSDYNKASSGQPDYDKFLACCYDADYLTVSDCSFGLHEYGLILGYPDDTAAVKAKYDGFPRITIAANKFYQTLTRGPGLMRWGYFHSFNNYVDTFSMAYTVHSGCDLLFSEDLRYPAQPLAVLVDKNEVILLPLGRSHLVEFTARHREHELLDRAHLRNRDVPDRQRPAVLVVLIQNCSFHDTTSVHG